MEYQLCMGKSIVSQCTIGRLWEKSKSLTQIVSTQVGDEPRTWRPMLRGPAVFCITFCRTGGISISRSLVNIRIYCIKPHTAVCKICMKHMAHNIHIIYSNIHTLWLRDSIQEIVTLYTHILEAFKGSETYKNAFYSISHLPCAVGKRPCMSQIIDIVNMPSNSDFLVPENVD